MGSRRDWSQSKILSEQVLRLQAGELALTYCQVPGVFQLAPKNSLTIARANGAKRKSESLRLDATTSREIFGRTGKIVQIDVHLTA